MDILERLSGMNLQEQIELAKSIKGQLDFKARQMDPDLPTEVRGQRLKAVAVELDLPVVLDAIRSRAEQVSTRRKAISDPMHNLANRAMAAAKDLSAGETAILTALSALPMDVVKNLIPSVAKNPAALLLVRADITKRMDAGAGSEEVMPLFTAWSEAAAGLVDQTEVRNAARSELSALRFVHESGQDFPAAQRLTLGHRVAELEKIITGTVQPPMPKLDLEPKQRMEQGRVEHELAREKALVGEDDE